MSGTTNGTLTWFAFDAKWLRQKIINWKMEMESRNRNLSHSKKKRGDRRPVWEVTSLTLNALISE